MSHRKVVFTFKSLEMFLNPSTRSSQANSCENACGNYENTNVVNNMNARIINRFTNRITNQLTTAFSVKPFGVNLKIG